MSDFPPVVTTESVDDEVPEGTHAVEIEPGKIFVGGVGLYQTKAYRLLEGWEAGQLTYVFPYLFSDMAEEYERSAAKRPGDAADAARHRE